ncbi:MAG: hypothetical protein ACP5MK_01195 [Candidatus Micrarchaeia archaeon]
MADETLGSKIRIQAPRHIRLDDDVEVVKDSDNSWHLVLKGSNKA